MLSRSIRIALIALLLAALPLRTWAASAMLFCADGPSAPAAHAQHGASSEHAGHDMAGGHAMHDADGTTAATDGAMDTGHGCSVCGACCTGVATGPTFATWSAHPPATISIPFSPPRYAGVDLARDKRPPVA